MSQRLSTLIIRTVTCVTRRFPAARRCRHVQFISLLLARYINAIEGALLNKGCRNPRTEQRRFHCCRYVPAFLTSHVFLYSLDLQYVVIFINILLLNLWTFKPCTVRLNIIRSLRTYHMNWITHSVLRMSICW